MPPEWLIVLAWVALTLGVVSADILGGGHRQPMPIMDVVWPLTALYFGPLGVWGYWRLSRVTTQERQKPVPA